jgi:hypothetical protein
VGVWLNALAAAPPTLHADTGELQPEGGELLVAMEELIVGADIVRAADVTAWARGGAGSVHATSALSNVIAFAGQASELSASSVEAEASASCDGVRGGVVIVGLEFGGQPIRVAGTPNQKEIIPGVGTLVINEQIVLARTREIMVRALHLIRASGEHVIIGNARAGMECVVGVEPLLWQDVKQRYRD